MQLQHQNRNVMVCQWYQLLFRFAFAISQSSVFTILINLMSNDQQTIGIVIGVKGVGQLVGSVGYMYILDLQELKRIIIVFFYIYTLVTVQILYAFIQEEVIHLQISQFLCGMFGSIFYPIANTIIAKSSNAENRTGIQINFVSLGTLSFSIGYLLVGLVFKIIDDEWDIHICKMVVGFGYSFQCVAIFLLIQVSKDHQESELVNESPEENLVNTSVNNSFNSNKNNEKVIKELSIHDKYTDFKQDKSFIDFKNDKNEKADKDDKPKHRRSTTLQAASLKSRLKYEENLGSGFFNMVLQTVFAHKMLDSLESLAVKQQAIFFKERMQLGPFYTQMINFAAVNIGAILSSCLMPYLCTLAGEAKTVNMTGLIAFIFFLGFLFAYHLEHILSWDNLLQWQVMVACLFMVSRGVTVCDTGVWKTITMDHTAKQHRGKWNNVDTLIAGITNVFIMCCGVLSQYTGIMALFQITAVVKLIIVVFNVSTWMLTQERYDKKDVEDNDKDSKQSQINSVHQSKLWG